MARVVGAQGVIVDHLGRVLLQLRPWPPGWEPPGGHVAEGEDPALTVMRETREECGLQIAIDRLTGVYHFRGIRVGIDHTFRAHPTGGTLRRTREALRLMWAEPDNLPPALFPWYRQRIWDALADPGPQPFERSQPVDLGDVIRHGAALGSEAAAVLARRRGQMRWP